MLFSFSVITLLSPLYLLISLLIKLDSKGPILYKGTRLGKHGKLITTFKFRTMCLDAEEKLTALIQSDPKLQQEWDTYQKIQSDPRCTRLGKFLRRSSLDEFPQFFNVLKGDLSIVGPRPYYTFELDNTKLPEKLLSIKPGITSIWQTSGRNSLSFENRIKLDALYIEKQSFLYDLYLILKTIPSLFSSQGAF